MTDDELPGAVERAIYDTAELVAFVLIFCRGDATQAIVELEKTAERTRKPGAVLIAQRAINAADDEQPGR